MAARDAVKCVPEITRNHCPNSAKCARIAELVAQRPDVRHVVLMCSAVNAIDASALESLEEINHRLRDADVTFHLTEVKGPVMDRLERADFLDHLTGRVFLSQFEAISAIRSANP